MLNQLNSDYLFVFIAAGFAIALIGLLWLILDLRRRWNGIFGKKNIKADDAIGEIFARLMQAENRLEKSEPRISALEEIGKYAIQKIGFMRFNPFEHTGGDQSFAAALLDRGDNGIVISSLYTREGVRVYAKEIQRGTSKHPLSDEEQQVLEQALKGKP